MHIGVVRDLPEGGGIGRQQTREIVVDLPEGFPEGRCVAVLEFEERAEQALNGCRHGEPPFLSWCCLVAMHN